MKKLVVVIILFFLCSNIFASIGKRKGFFIGLGFGASQVSYTSFSSDYATSFEEEFCLKSGIATDFKMGYAFTNNFLLYYSVKNAFISDDIIDDEIQIVNQAHVLGCAVYVTEKTYVSSGFGLSSWIASYESKDSDDWYGTAAVFGGGYEFAKHLNVNIDVIINDPVLLIGGTEISGAKLGFLLTLTALAY